MIRIYSENRRQGSMSQSYDFVSMWVETLHFLFITLVIPIFHLLKTKIKQFANPEERKIRKPINRFRFGKAERLKA